MAGVWVFNFLTDEEIGFRKVKSGLFCKIQEQKVSGYGFGDLLVQKLSQGVQEGHGRSKKGPGSIQDP